MLCTDVMGFTFTRQGSATLEEPVHCQGLGHVVAARALATREEEDHQPLDAAHEGKANEAIPGCDEYLLSSRFSLSHDTKQIPSSYFLQARAFYTWIDQVQWRKRMRVVMDRSARRLRNAGIAKAFDAWRSTVEGSKVDFHLTKKEELAVGVITWQTTLLGGFSCLTTHISPSMVHALL